MIFSLTFTLQPFGVHVELHKDIEIEFDSESADGFTSASADDDVIDVDEFSGLYANKRMGF